MGVVTDNRDPEGLGRVRVSTDMSVPGGESPWLCVAGQWKKKGSGWWVLPEIGTQALVVYTSKDRSRGYVLGYIYDRRHLPPERGGDSGTVVLEGKKVRGEIREGKDGETIILESKDGELRIELDSGKGISIRNGKGDIKIKCRSFTAESEGAAIKAEGVKSGSESVKTKASGGAALEGGGDTKLKGKNIRLKGSRGVTAEGKAAARQDDKVGGAGGNGNCGDTAAPSVHRTDKGKDKQRRKDRGQGDSGKGKRSETQRHDAHAAAGNGKVPERTGMQGGNKRGNGKKRKGRRKGSGGDRKHGDDVQRCRGTRQQHGGVDRGINADACHSKPPCL